MVLYLLQKKKLLSDVSRVAMYWLDVEFDMGIAIAFNVNVELPLIFCSLLNLSILINYWINESPF